MFFPRVCIASLFCFSVLLMSGTAYAFHADSFRNKELPFNSTIPASLSVEVGVVNGQARELVYEDNKGQKTSELQWDIDNVLMVGVKGSVDFSDWLSFNGGVWTNLTKGDNGKMDDYDWNTPADPRGWSYWSRSKVSVDRVLILDSNLETKIFDWDYLTLSGLLGFKFDNWKWDATGGDFIYSIAGWRDVAGSFSDEVGIGYEQWFYCPYVGLQTDSDFGDFKLKTYVKGTIYAWAQDEDHHYARNILFKENFYNMKYIGAGISGSYSFTSNIFSTISFDYQKFFHQYGSMEAKDESSGKIYTFNNNSGIDNEVIHVAIELGFNF